MNLIDECVARMNRTLSAENILTRGASGGINANAMAHTLLIPCSPEKVSDGYHSFEDLYQHRNVLFLALMQKEPHKAWMAKAHEDGSMYGNMFVCGLETDQGQLTYHLPLELWQIALCTGASVLLKAPAWDGHGSDEVANRIIKGILGLRNSTEAQSEEIRVDTGS